MPVQEEPTVESLSQDISELQKIVKDLQMKVEALSRRTALPLVPHIPSPGSIGEKTLSIGQRVVNPHSNDGVRVTSYDEDVQRLAYERVTNS